MASLGIRVHIDKGQPAVAAVLLEGTKSAATMVEPFLLTTNETTTVEQIQDLASALKNRLIGLGEVEGVAIRRADFSPSSKKEGPKTRLLVEGAMIKASREQVESTSCASARDLAQTCGIKKAEMDAQGTALTDDKKMFEAAAAGWSILPD